MKFSVFSVQMETLNQDVSELAKGLHHIMHILQAHVSVHHCTSLPPSYPYSIQTMSIPTTVPSADLPLNQPSASALGGDPISHVACSLQMTPPYRDGWSCSSEAPKTQPENVHQPRTSASRPGPPVTSGSQPGSRCVSESNAKDMWTSTSLRSISPGFQGRNPGLASHENSGHRPVSLSTTAAISKSQPTLCLQPPGDSADQPCPFFGAPCGLSTHSLLDTSPTSYPHLCLPSETEVKLSPATQEDICVLSTPASNSLIQDTSIFQISDSNPFILPVSASATPPVLAVESILGSASPQSDTPEPRLPLGDPSSVDHDSLECLLGNGGSLESRDSESVSSQRSSVGLQTQSSEQSWCLDLTD